MKTLYKKLLHNSRTTNYNQNDIEEETAEKIKIKDKNSTRVMQAVLFVFV